MSFKVMADNNQSITSAQDAAMYNVFANNQDFIIGDIGAEMAVSHNAASLSVSLGTGEAVICGRHVSAVGSNALTLPANTSAKLVLRYDLLDSNIAKLATTQTLASGNLNDGDTTRDLLLGSFVTSSSGVTSFTDQRNIKANIFNPNELPQIFNGTAAPDNLLGKDGDIYIQWQQ